MKIKRILAAFLALCLVLPCLMVGARAEETASGTCGDGLTWVVDEQMETLTISGSGAMTDYSLENPAPWSEYNFMEIRIGADVTKIGEYAFANLDAYTITFGGDAPEIAENAFLNMRLDGCFYPEYNSTWTDEVMQKYGARYAYWMSYLPDGVCGENVTWELNEETGVMTISGTGPMADFGMDGQPWYWDRKLITSVVIGSGVTSVGSQSFAGATNLTSVSLPDTLVKIGGVAFRGCPVSSINFPDGLTHIYELAFQNHKLESVILPASVTYLGTMAFAQSNTLTRVEIPGNLTYIGDYLFSGCSNLADIWFYGDAPETIEEDAFNNLTATTIHYPAGNDTWTDVVNQEYEDSITWEPFTPNPFTDVTEDKYYYEPVLWAYYSGITSGRTETTFAPNETCTRAQVMTFLWAAAGRPEPELTENPFTDVSESAYYYKAVLWAVGKGITSGTSATTFSPNASCTRNQVVTFLWVNAGRPEPTIENPFTDVEAGKYYYKAVLWAYENGITSGTTATTFGPHNPCTRGQIVTFLYQALAEK